MNHLPIPNPRNQTETEIHQPVLKVLGLGGGGGNAIDRMLELGIRGVEFIAANTDQQALKRSKAPNKIQLGPKTTRGLGAGGIPAIGQKSAEESWRAIAAAIEDSDMVFLTAGMGGGTGTGAIPIAAQIAHKQGAVTIAIVTTPFSFEMGRRQRNANAGLTKLRDHTDTLITIPNDRLLQVAPEDLPLETAFCLADDVLRQAVQGITELITEPGLINVDFAHIRRLMLLGGGALMAIGHGRGEEKAIKALKQSLNHPLLEDISINQATGVIVNFTAGDDLTLSEVSEALAHLHEQTNDKTEIVMGTTQNDRMQDRAEVILIVTGIGAPAIEDVIPGADRITQLRTESNQRISPPDVETKPASAPVRNLDIPAFMRRRSRSLGS